MVALGDLLAEVRVLARQRDRECAAQCDRTRTPPAAAVHGVPEPDPERDAWQEAIDAELRALLRDGQYEAARDRIVAQPRPSTSLETVPGVAGAARMTSHEGRPDAQASMLTMVGLSHRNAPLAVRERFAIPADELPAVREAVVDQLRGGCDRRHL